MNSLKRLVRSKKFNTIFYGVACIIFCCFFISMLMDGESLLWTIYAGSLAIYSGFLLYWRGLKK